MAKKNKEKRSFANWFKRAPHLFTNNGRSTPVHTLNGFKDPTTCCALAIYSLKDSISDDELEYFIKRQTDEAKLEWQPWSRVSGETCMAVVTVNPFEPRLEEKLLKRGFKNVWQFSRRNGYPQDGYCKLWVLNVNKFVPVQVKRVDGLPI